MWKIANLEGQHVMGLVSCERGGAFEEGEDGDCLAVNGRVCSRSRVGGF